MASGNNTTPGGMAPEPQAALVGAIRRLLKPLVRVLIANGIGLPYLVDLLKESFVETAVQYFSPEGGRLTDSRLSVMTGVHRKDVKRLREQSPDAAAPPRSVSRGARMIGLWTGDSRYLDADQQPRRLGRQEFEALVLSVSQDVHPRTIIDEWLQRGLLETDDNGDLQLRSEAFVPSENVSELAYYFGRNLHDHLAAAGENLAGRQPPHLERAVYYGGLTPESVAELQALANARVSPLLVEFNREILARREQDRDDPEANQRFCLGAYVYSTGQEMGAGR
jgi:hypothetical protein